MRGGARVLPGARCFRGAAVFGVRGAAAVFGVGGAAAVCAIFRRRSRSARFAAVPPPGCLPLSNYSGAGFCRACFF